MSVFITIIHVIVCVILIVAVLLQSGKAADLAGAFGGMGSQSVFGPRSAATLLSKLTTISAVLFMITSLGLWILSSRGTTRSVLSGEEAPVQEKPAATTEVKKEAEDPAVKPAAAQPGEEKKAPDSEKKAEDPEKKSPEEKKN
ncbi:MAG: preprotein translocase subunit SecG [Candidatus Aminicenantes bacterium]|jgi:preprotein translocase subunit SecG